MIPRGQKLADLATQVDEQEDSHFCSAAAFADSLFFTHQRGFARGTGKSSSPGGEEKAAHCPATRKIATGRKNCDRRQPVPHPSFSMGNRKSFARCPHGAGLRGLCERKRDRYPRRECGTGKAPLRRTRIRRCGTLESPSHALVSLTVIHGSLRRTRRFDFPTLGVCD